MIIIIIIIIIDMTNSAKNRKLVQIIPDSERKYVAY